MAIVFDSDKLDSKVLLHWGVWIRDGESAVATESREYKEDIMRYVNRLHETEVISSRSHE